MFSDLMNFSMVDPQLLMMEIVKHQEDERKEFSFAPLNVPASQKMNLRHLFTIDFMKTMESPFVIYKENVAAKMSLIKVLSADMSSIDGCARYKLMQGTASHFVVPFDMSFSNDEIFDLLSLSSINHL